MFNQNQTRINGRNGFLVILLNFEDLFQLQWQLVSTFLSVTSPWYNYNGWLGVKHQVTYCQYSVFQSVSDNVFQSLTMVRSPSFFQTLSLLFNCVSFV